MKQSQDSKNIIKKLNFEGVPNYASDGENMDVNIQFKSMNHNIVIGRSTSGLYKFRTKLEDQRLHKRSRDMS